MSMMSPVVAAANAEAYAKAEAKAQKLQHDRDSVLKQLEEREVFTDVHAHQRKVLVIYTGGTFGCKAVDGHLVPMPPSEMFAALNAHPQLAHMYDRADPNPAPEGSWLHFQGLVDRTTGQTIDSAEATPSLWNHLAELVDEAQDEYHGFVIIHGTDTLAHTAAALSFMLAGTLRTVVVTGSQSPLASPVSDAMQNLVGAIHACRDVTSRGGHAVQDTLGGELRMLVGVYVYFDGKLLLGSRCAKVDAKAHGAFANPNLGVVGHAQPSLSASRMLVYDTETLSAVFAQQRGMFDLRTAHAQEDFPSDAEARERPAVLRNIDSDIAVLPQHFDKNRGTWLVRAREDIRIKVLTVMPGIQSFVADEFEALKGCDGLIVQSYGPGHLPTAVIAMLRRLRAEAHVPVVVLTECHSSNGFSPAYEVSVPRDAGVPCYDMPVASAYARMLIAVSQIAAAAGAAVPKQQLCERVEEVMHRPFLLCFTDPKDRAARARMVSAGH